MAAVEAGADALGFVFAESPRKVDVPAVLNILGRLPPLVTTVGVFAEQGADEISVIMENVGLHFAQLHGDIDGSVALSQEEARRGLIRGLRIQSAEDIRGAAEDDLVGICDAILLDAHVEGLMGGSGQTFDWDLAVQAHSIGKPIILAGGLNPANVEEAVRKVRPYAVDVSTGVEASPGKKDHEKIREFILNARKAE